MYGRILPRRLARGARRPDFEPGFESGQQQPDDIHDESGTNLA
jgi:hypothetical protein